MSSDGGDGDRADPENGNGDRQVELADADGTIISDEMVQILSRGRSTEWDVREDEYTG